MKYPRRKAVRGVLRWSTGRLIHLLGNLQVEGIEHVPEDGPVILAANHFSFVDAPILLYTSPRMVEFIGGAQRPNSPSWSQTIPKMWGFIRAYRGGYGRSTFRQSLDVLKQDGVLGIFPEGGNWAELLRPARPGLGFIAARSGAPVVPISITGAEHILGKGKAPTRVTFHEPVAAPTLAAKGSARRAEIDAFGQTVMSAIAAGLPDDQRGMHSACPEARAAAEAVSAYPFDAPEMRGM